MLKNTTTQSTRRPEPTAPLTLDSLADMYYNRSQQCILPECYLVSDTVASALRKELDGTPAHVPFRNLGNWRMFGIQVIPIPDLYAARIPGLRLDGIRGCTRQQAGEVLAAIAKVKRGEIKMGRDSNG